MPETVEKVASHFFEEELRCALRLPAYSRCDARSARSIFCHAHVSAENDFTLFAACGRRTLRGFFDKLGQDTLPERVLPHISKHQKGLTI